MRRPHKSLVEGPTVRPPWQFSRRAFGVAMVLLASSIGCDQAKSDPEPAPREQHAPPRAPTAEELAVIAPLVKGSSLGGWEVARVEGTNRGALRVVCRKDRA